MRVLNLGLTDYMQAYQTQLETVSQVLAGQEDTLIVCSHPSVVTLGKKSRPGDLRHWDGPVYQVERGGQATYHGPGQLIIYPILNLKHFRHDLSGFLECLEQAMIDILQRFDLQASGNPQRGTPDYTGVWVDEKKIASIGIAVKKWVTYHGLAINIDRDPLAFQGINPCGFSSSIMTSLAEQTEAPFERQDLENQLVAALRQQFQRLSNK